MVQYISKAAVMAEIEVKRDMLAHLKYIASNYNDEKTLFAVEKQIEQYESLISFLDTLDVQENKLPNPRFPHLDNIVDKVFGTANLEPFEYEEAEQLVLLAKEELLKDLEVKEVDLEKVFEEEYSKFSNDTDAGDYALPICLSDYRDFAKHFFELGLNTQKGE